MSAGTAPALIRTSTRATTLKQIPDALRSLWQACCPETPGGDVARALTINFVGVAAAAEERSLREAVDRLLRRTPCRAFLLLVDETAREPAAAVAAMTRNHGSTRDIVLEEIALRLPPSWFPQMPGLVRPLLVNDLQNHLFWASPWPRDEQHFDALSRLCDHVVVDTRRFELPAIELERLQTRRADGRRLTDLAWLRLRPWRRALAESFERVRWTPGMTTRATVRHGRQGLASAMLFGQWLAGRLGAAVALEDSGNGEATCPEAVDLHTEDFDIQLAADGSQITVHVTTAAHCYLPFTVPTSRGSDGDLLAAAIDIG